MISSKYGSEQEYQTSQDIDHCTRISLATDNFHTSSKSLPSYQISLVFHKQQQFLSSILNEKKHTLDLLAFLLKDLSLLVISFYSFFPFGVIFLQKLTEINKMNLNLKIPFSDILLYGFECFLLPASKKMDTSYVLISGPRKLSPLRTFSFASTTTLSLGTQSRIAHAQKF